MKFRTFACAAIILCCCVNVAFAAPQKVNFQGKLTDAAGNPISVSVSMVFSIYDVASGGTALWTETQTVAVTNGIYNVLLGGDNNPIDTELTETKALWLGVKVGADAEMSPRVELTPGVYDVIMLNTITVKNGNVGINVLNPTTKFHIKGDGAQDTVLWLQSGEWNSAGDYAEIRLGDSSHYIRGEHTKGMTFYDTNKFTFVGAPIEIPWANGQDNQSPGIAAAGSSSDDFLYDGEYIKHMGFGFHQYKDNSSGYVGINSYIAAYYGVDIFTCGTSRIRVNHDGRVGIGTNAPQYKLHVAGTMKVDGADFAEPFDMTDIASLELGDVVVIDPANPIHVKKSVTAYDTLVVGVVSSSEQAGYVAGSRSDGTSDKPVALVGRVLCNVSTENGAIRIGDLLTTSDTPGYAMKATDKDRMHGTLLGKALQAFDGDTGQIMVLVALQ